MTKSIRAHCPICGGESERPADTVAGMTEAPEAIAQAVRTEAGSGAAGWSPAEIAAHLADIEVGLAWRIRQTLSEDEPELQPFDQDAWATATHYPERDVENSLRAFEALRTVNVEIMRRMTEVDWSRKFRHREFGTVPIRVLIEHISDHDLAHLRQIKGM